VADLLAPPDPDHLHNPGALRWAAGSPDGPRSLTSCVIGGNNDDSVYIATRSTIKDMKLSLHPTRWRMAFTDNAAANHVPPGEDRVLTRWAIPIEMAEGWRLAAVILTPSATFGAAWKEPRTNDRRPILWFPAPPAPERLRFYVLLGEPDAPALTVLNIIGDVGRMTLKSGKRVWVIADVITMTDELQQAVDNIRAQMATRAQPASIGWAWGEVDDVPNLLDMASVLPHQPPAND
jgi:hypothetical protein